MNQNATIEDNNFAVYCSRCGHYIMDAKNEMQYKIASKLLICHICAEDLRTIMKDSMVEDRRKYGKVIKSRTTRLTDYKRGYAKGFIAGFKEAHMVVSEIDGPKNALELMGQSVISLNKYWTVACSSCSNNTKVERQHLCNHCRRRSGKAPTNWIPMSSSTFRARMMR